MTDENGTQATAEYYTIRIYRRGPARAGAVVMLVGVIADVDGKERVFRCSEELWAALVGRIGGGRIDG